MAKRVDIGLLTEPIEMRYKNVRVAIEQYTAVDSKKHHGLVVEVSDKGESVTYNAWTFEQHLPHLISLKDDEEGKKRLDTFADLFFGEAEKELMEEHNYMLEPEIKGAIKAVLAKYRDKFFGEIFAS